VIRAFHFVGATLRDDSPIPPDGEWLEFSGACRMCKSGLHASRHPFDALQYAPSVTLCLVECDDVASEQDDKLVCSRRKIIARFDATDLLREYGRWCAMSVIHLWDPPQVVRDYLTTGNDEFRAAAYSAADSARSAYSAADSAYAAAYSAADSARSAYSAARSAYAAAYSAARSQQRAHFLSLVTAKFSAMGVTV
jgi:hypothetical protein